MRYRKIFWGIVLLIFGILLILKNIGIININWAYLFHLWPCLLIFWGISVLPVKYYVKFVLFLLTLILIVWVLDRPDNKAIWVKSENTEKVVTNDMDEQILKEPFDSFVTSATLKMNAAAGDFKINDITDELIVFKKAGNIGNYNMGIEKKSTDSKIIRIELDSPVKNLSNTGNKVDIKLNSAPVWDFDFDIGAANADFNFSNYKTKTIKINGGAAVINLKMGDKLNKTDIEINTGASAMDIQIPMTSGCEIKSETFLVDKDLDGFKKNNEDTYTTDNFKNSTNKIYIKVDAGLSSFKVTRY